jgi:DNA-binding MarR family transcriptional regulator
MQSFDHATNGTLPEVCAKEALLAVPAVMRFVREQMRRHRQEELTVPQFRALIFVSVNEDASLSPMAEHLGLSLPAASRMVDLLVRRGLMRRQPDLADRRCVRLTLTTRGGSVYRAALRATQAALAERFRTLGHNDLKLVQDALQTLTRVFAVNGASLSPRSSRSAARLRRPI